MGAWLSETFGFGSTLRLREMKAVYYPIWRTDVIYEGKVGQSGKKMDHHGWIGARGAYVPGESGILSRAYDRPEVNDISTETQVTRSPHCLTSPSPSLPWRTTWRSMTRARISSSSVKGSRSSLFPSRPARWDCWRRWNRPWAVTRSLRVWHLTSPPGSLHWFVLSAKCRALTKQVACYPIMFPIYIADFEYEAGEGEMRSMNIVMDAHDENVRRSLFV